MFKVTGIVMKYAPIGVGAAIAVTVGHRGLSVLMNLGLLILTLYGAVIVFIYCCPGSGRVFLRDSGAAVLQGYQGTCDHRLFHNKLGSGFAPGVRDHGEVRRSAPNRFFCPPHGYSFNLDGSTLYLSLAAIFVAQAAGIELSFGQQILMMLTLMLTSKGVAGVPRASLVILAGTLASFGLPLEGVAVILGVDEILDMARTALNLIGNCLATAVVARWEGELQTTPEPVAVES